MVFYYLTDEQSGEIITSPTQTGPDWPRGMPLIVNEREYARFLKHFLERERSVVVNIWPPKPEKTHIPYLSQWGDGANVRTGDCGPACVAMLVHGYRPARPTVDQVAAACGQPSSGEGSKYTGHTQLRQGAAHYGITLETRSPYTESRLGKQRLSLDLIITQLNAGVPSIALIHYGVLRDGTNNVGGLVKNQDQGYSRGHWVVTLDHDGDMIYINDPDFWGARVLEGSYRAVPKDVFNDALRAVSPGCTVGEQGLIVL